MTPYLFPAATEFQCLSLIDFAINQLFYLHILHTYIVFNFFYDGQECASKQNHTQLPRRAADICYQLMSLSRGVHTDDGPPARWIVNFDRDFVDGLVLAAVLAAYCPYLVSTALRQLPEPALTCP